jgi:hypothetical protein
MVWQVKDEAAATKNFREHGARTTRERTAFSAGFANDPRDFSPRRPARIAQIG